MDVKSMSIFSSRRLENNGLTPHNDNPHNMNGGRENTRADAMYMYVAYMHYMHYMILTMVNELTIALIIEYKHFLLTILGKCTMYNCLLLQVLINCIDITCK